MPQDNPPLLDKTMNTTESTPRNLADVLASGLANIANNVKPDGSDISIDVPGMSATNVDDGFSELKQSLANKEWTRILNETASSRNYDETKSIDSGKLFSQYSELMFVMMNANSLRIMGTTIVPVGAFQNGAVYVLGAGDIGADYLYNAVFIYASDSTVEIAIGAKSGNPIASYVFRIYAR